MFLFTWSISCVLKFQGGMNVGLSGLQEYESKAFKMKISFIKKTQNKPYLFSSQILVSQELR